MVPKPLRRNEEAHYNAARGPLLANGHLAEASHALEPWPSNPERLANGFKMGLAQEVPTLGRPGLMRSDAMETTGTTG